MDNPGRFCVVSTLALLLSLFGVSSCQPARFLASPVAQAKPSGAGALASLPHTLSLVTGDFPPFSGENLPGYGLAAEIVSRTLQDAGFEVEIAFLPWARGYNAALAGEFAGAFPYSKNDERTQAFLYSEPLYTFRETFFVRERATIPYADLQDLRGRRVCVPTGYNLFALEAPVKEGWVQLDRPVDLEACFKMLHAERTDMVMIMEPVGWAVIERVFGGRAGFRVLEKPLLENSDHLIISKTYPGGENLLARFNQSLLDLRQKGVIDQIILKYLQ